MNFYKFNFKQELSLTTLPVCSQFFTLKLYQYCLYHKVHVKAIRSSENFHAQNFLKKENLSSIFSQNNFHKSNSINHRLINLIRHFTRVSYSSIQTSSKQNSSYLKYIPNGMNQRSNLIIHKTLKIHNHYMCGMTE